MKAQLAQEIPLSQLITYLKDGDWYAEQKLDGHRILLDVNDQVLVAYNRDGRAYSKRLPPLRESLPPLAGHWLFDGELLEDTYWVFDVLYSSDQSVTHRPFRQRRELIGRLAPFLTRTIRLLPSTRDSDAKLRLALETLKSGAEGLVLKHAEAPYRQGTRSTEMLKAKFTHTADVVVLELGRDGKDNAVLGLVHYDEGGVSLREVGAASTIGKRFGLRVGDVVEVRFLYATDDDRLYQPRLVRPRWDKRMRECTVDQLRYASKSVLNLTGGPDDHARGELPADPQDSVPKPGTAAAIRPTTDGPTD